MCSLCTSNVGATAFDVLSPKELEKLINKVSPQSIAIFCRMNSQKPVFHTVNYTPFSLSGTEENTIRETNGMMLPRQRRSLLRDGLRAANKSIQNEVRVLLASKQIFKCRNVKLHINVERLLHLTEMHTSEGHSLAIYSWNMIGGWSLQCSLRVCN